MSVSLVGSTLQEQRHNLALELLWVQQAIHSRKQVCRSFFLHGRVQLHTEHMTH